MTAFATRTIQQIRGLIILGGFVLLVIPFGLLLSGTAFVVIAFGLGFLVAEIAWKRLQWIRTKISKAKRRCQLW